MAETNENDPFIKPVDTLGEVPHSGVHFDERPVEEFDNTTLQEATDQGLIGPVPETLSAIAPPEAPVVETPKPRRTKLYIGTGAAALAVAGGAFLSAGVSSSDTPKKPSTTSSNPEMDALQRDTEKFLEETRQQSEAGQTAAAELAAATPRYVTYDPQTHLHPTAEDVKTLLWDIQIGVLRADDRFINAALGDEAENGASLPAAYATAQQQVTEARQFGTVDLTNFYYGPDETVLDPIAQDPEHPWIFTVAIESRFKDKVHRKTQRFILEATENAAAGGMTWNIQQVTDIA